MAKFNIGDILVARFKECYPLDPLLSFETVTDIQPGEYFLTTFGNIPMEQAEADYVRVEDVLWRHYILDTTINQLQTLGKPVTIEEARNLFTPRKSIDTFLITAYWEGFKIPIKKEIEFIDGDVLVRRSDVGKPIEDNNHYLPNVKKADQDAGMYYLSDGSAVDLDTAHSTYLNAFGSKVLWYWEFKTDGDWSMPLPTRKSFQKVVGINIVDGKSVTAMRTLYSLGFSIKE